MFDLLIVARSFGYASDRAMQVLGQRPDLRVEKPEHTAAFGEDQMCELIPGRDAVIVGTDKITSAVIARADRLKVISKHGVGVDNIDIAAATQAGILVTNLPGMNDKAVADMAFGMMLALVRGICLANSAARRGDWGKLLTHDVWGKTLGVVGTGRIGQVMIRRALAFDMRVIAYDVAPDDQAARTLGYTYVSFDDLLAEADIVTLHVPLLPETRGMIGAEELARMKESAYLINTSRGGIVDEDALVDALREGGIAGAALDVFEKYPPESEGIGELDNLLVTPHLAAYTYETLEGMDMTLVEAYDEILRGELPTRIGILNPEVKRFRETTR